MTSQPSINIKPVGYVRTKSVGDEVKDRSQISEIVVLPELQKALDGITDYSHLYVLFWLHEVSTENRLALKVHPRGRNDMPLVGVFAVRTNLRPNPIGLTLVKLLKVEENVLAVQGLDAFNGTPVLDIKPYDTWDVAENPKVPDWWMKLEAEKQKNSI